MPKKKSERSELKARLKELDRIEQNALAMYDEAQANSDFEAAVDWACVVTRARSARATVLRVLDGRAPVLVELPIIVSRSVN